MKLPEILKPNIQLKETRRSIWPLLIFVLILIWIMRSGPDKLVPCESYMPNPEKNCVNGKVRERPTPKALPRENPSPSER